MRATRVVAPVALAAFASELAVRLLAPRGRLAASTPAPLERYFSSEEVQRGARYTRGQAALGIAGTVLDAAILAALARRPRLPGQRLRPILGGSVDGAAISLLSTGAGLPLAALRRRRALAVGLATQSWSGWAVDQLKAGAIQTAFAAGTGGGVVALTRRYPRGWWLPSAGASLLLGTGLATLAPIVLDPIFNDFDPLPEGEQRRDVLELARAAGVKVGEVYSIDASRRTTAANAYVTGLGPTKRVVLFDTLLDRYERDEVRVVVAHELAHVRHRDVLRSIAFAAITAPAAALAVQRLSWALSPERGAPAALPALALATGIASAPVAMIANRLSRAVERRADAFSLSLSCAPGAFISFERKIALQNVADLDPPKWLTSLLSTHPPTAQRIGMGLEYAKQAGAPAPAS